MNGIRTLPGFLGRNKIKNILIFLNTIHIFLLIFSYSQGFFHKYLLVLILDILYGYWYIIHFCQEGINIGKSLDLLVDGEFIMLAVFALATDKFGFLNLFIKIALVCFSVCLIRILPFSLRTINGRFH